MKLIEIMNLTSRAEFRDIRIMFESEEKDIEFRVTEEYKERNPHLNDDALRFQYFANNFGHAEIEHLNVYDGKLLIWL